MKAMTFLKGLGLGAGLMYFYDPQLGRRRRKLALDQLNHTLCELGHSADVACRDAQNRLQGCVAEFRSALQERDNSDPVVHDRVRSKLGRYVSHPSAVQVEVTDGRVVLSGPVLANEVEPLVERLKSVSGVRSVENRLESHASAGNLAALQGGRRRTGETLDIFQQNWSPSTRCFVGSLGGAMLLGAVRGGGLMGLVKGAGGACLLACAASHAPRKGSAPTARAAGRNAGPTQTGSAAHEPSQAAEMHVRSGPT